MTIDARHNPHGLDPAVAPATGKAPGRRTLTSQLPARSRGSESVADDPEASAPATSGALQLREAGARQSLAGVLPPMDDPFGLHLPEFAAPPRSVQTKAASARGGANSEIQATAALGIAGPGGTLPHLDQIQVAFGHHDVRGVRAHVGGNAERAATAIGATAYATGNDVALPSGVDLHTTAHEAAHVVQQRAGVHLKGGVGQAGDAYERHADAVADRVVAGESAAALLDTMVAAPSPSAAPSGGAIQRKGLADDNEGRGIAHLRDQQPLAAPRISQFPTLPAWAGMNVQDLVVSDMLSMLTELPLTSVIPANKVATLGRDWKAHLESGSSTRSAEANGFAVHVTAGYKNAVARGNNTYYAELTWNIAVVEFEADPSGEGGKIHERLTQVMDRGRIVFTTKGPIEIAPAARRPDALGLDPTESADHGAGAISCAPGDAADPNDPKCFMTQKEREELVGNTKAVVAKAHLNFVNACRERRAAIKAAVDADTAFAMGLVDVALGFGLSRLVGAAVKAGTKYVARNPPKFSPKTISPEEIMAVADGQAMASQILGSAPLLTKLAEKAIDASGAKGMLTSKLKPLLASSSSEADIIVALEAGSDSAFRRVQESLPSHTDDELLALSETFRAASQEGYAQQLAGFLGAYSRDVASLGEYDAHYAQDFAEKLVWMLDLTTGKKRLARMRVDIADRKEGGGGPVKHPRTPKFLGWVAEEMIPFALERHQRIFGEVKDEAQVAQE